MLLDLLSNNGEYGLALAPGFFRFYAHCGILNAFEELSIFNPSHVSGSSAGALVGTMIAAGLKPSIMADKLFALKRDDFWDAGSTVFGLLKGEVCLPVCLYFYFYKIL
jgi:NTE family protein